MFSKEDNEISISNYDEVTILDNFSSDIALDSIKQQLENIGSEDITNSSDLFDSIESTYKHLMEKYKDNEELCEKIEDTMIQMAEDILNIIQNKLDFEISFSQIMLNKDKIFLIHMIYSFFICNIENNIESFLFNYFLQNVDKFPKIEINKKDQVYLQLKEIIPENVLNQVYNAIENIESALCHKFVAEDIFELMIEDDPETIDNYWINSIFIDNFMVDINYGDNFISNMVKWFVECGDKIYKVQNRIINEYKTTE